MQITEVKVKIARDFLCVVCECHKKYLYQKHKAKTFEVCEKVMLKVLPWKGFILFGKGGELIPCYIGLLVVLEHINGQEYILELLPEPEGIHDVFYICYMRKYLANEPSIPPLDELQVGQSKWLVDESEAILERENEAVAQKEGEASESIVEEQSLWWHDLGIWVLYECS